MKKSQTTLTSFLVGIALACFGGQASADTQSFTETYGSSSAPLAIGGPDFPAQLAFPEFNISLGDLTDIEVTLTTTAALWVDVDNAGAAAVFANAQAAGTITVSGPNGTETSASLVTTPFSGSVASGAFVQGPEASLSSASVSHVALLDFGAYEGNGDRSLDFPLNATWSGTFSGTGPPGLLFAGDASAFGSVEIDYSYVTAVPEPGNLLSLSLLCFGGLAGINRLCRARSSKPSDSVDIP